MKEDNPFCDACEQKDCKVSHDGTCSMIRRYQGAVSLDQMQNELAGWHSRNFPNSSPENMLIGTMEELGELAHANLKGRVLGEDLVAQEKDAIGDIVIFLTQYCNMRGFSMSVILAETWAEVRQRDYRKTRKEKIDREQI